MTQTEWEKLHQKEQKLMEQEETMAKEIRQIKQVKDIYDDHFRNSQRVMDQLRHLFYKNDERTFYETTMSEFSRESKKIMNYVDEGERKLKARYKIVENKLSDVASEKRRASLAEKE
ncbi:DUF3958 family protein [Bacillus nitratireducens]|uniref:DUF3958 family protein n=1 Tax=Bacillus nitratireducens TaxID=2026193 RepID=UPI000899E76C|nr:DUF3958 family protein [Bacillus nitratireducens]PFH73744.1 hypothetical protein COI61_23120 [Bacillus cereus]SEB22526.1 hypothetical protein SAMN04488146_1394 [Bacillus nitratireducens]